MQPTTTATTAREGVLAEELRGAATTVAGEIEGTAHVTISVVRHGQPWASVFTQPDAEALEAIERTSGGPALDALWSGRVARIPTTLRNTLWPEYVHECRRQGVGSVAAFPIEVDGVRRGVLTVASNNYYAFAEAETRIGIDAAAQTSHMLRAALGF